jgi:hypothetical protein
MAHPAIDSSWPSAAHATAAMPRPAQDRVMVVATRGPATPYQASSSEFAWILGLLAAHAVLGVAMYNFRQSAVVHALLVFAVGLYVVMRKTPVTVAYVGAYIAGSEVLWRLLGTPVPWEIGKYSISTLFGLALLRMGRRANWRLLPLIYFLMLLPSALAVLQNAGLDTNTVRMMLSFNLSGPLALCLSVWFLSQLSITRADLRRIILAFVAPCAALAAITLVATYAGEELVFTTESNEVTSGGFGPNQVSSALGIAAMLSFLCAIDRTADASVRAVNAFLVMLLAMQSAMTFSRGGLYSATLALAAGAPFLLRARQTRWSFIAVCVFAVGAATIVVVPRLQTFTGGALETRFADTNPTNRLTLLRDDLRIWTKHPLLGVGPGASSDHRKSMSGSGHTEYSRMLAEHGLFGFVSLLALCGMFLQALLARADAQTRGLRAILLAASALSMSTAAMRIAAFALMFGLAHARLLGTSRSKPRRLAWNQKRTNRAVTTTATEY